MYRYENIKKSQGVDVLTLMFAFLFVYKSLYRKQRVERRTVMMQNPFVLPKIWSTSMNTPQEAFRKLKNRNAWSIFFNEQIRNG
jgi:hypothetical protein